MRISAPDAESDEENGTDAQSLQVKELKAEIDTLRSNLSALKDNDARLCREKVHLESLLKVALFKLFPEKKLQSDGALDEQALEDYLQVISQE